MNEGLFFMIFGLAALYFTLWIFILLPARMAETRGRSAFGWVFISIFFSTILLCLFLMFLGNNPNRQTD